MQASAKTPCCWQRNYICDRLLIIMHLPSTKHYLNNPEIRDQLYLTTIPNRHEQPSSCMGDLGQGTASMQSTTHIHPQIESVYTGDMRALTQIYYLINIFQTISVNSGHLDTTRSRFALVGGGGGALTSPSVAGHSSKLNTTNLFNCASDSGAWPGACLVNMRACTAGGASRSQ